MVLDQKNSLTRKGKRNDQPFILSAAQKKGSLNSIGGYIRGRFIVKANRWLLHKPQSGTISFGSWSFLVWSGGNAAKTLNDDDLRCHWSPTWALIKSLRLWISPRGNYLMTVPAWGIHLTGGTDQWWSRRHDHAGCPTPRRGEPLE